MPRWGSCTRNVMVGGAAVQDASNIHLWVKPSWRVTMLGYFVVKATKLQNTKFMTRAEWVWLWLIVKISNSNMVVAVRPLRPQMSTTNVGLDCRGQMAMYNPTWSPRLAHLCHAIGSDSDSVRCGLSSSSSSVGILVNKHSWFRPKYDFNVAHCSNSIKYNAVLA